MKAILIYSMVTNKIPKTYLDEIQRLQRGFIWGETEDKKKYHVVGRVMVTKPKWTGALGLRLDTINKACLLNSAWRLYIEPNDFWCNVLRGKNMLVIIFWNLSPVAS
jgi:hypothetical protein